MSFVQQRFEDSIGKITKLFREAGEVPDMKGGLCELGKM